MIMPEKHENSKVSLLPPIVAFMAGRGGTGKSTACVNIASLVAESGNNVLVVDLDLSALGATHIISKKTGALHCKTITDIFDEILEPENKPKKSMKRDIWSEGMPLSGPVLLQRYTSGQVLGALHFLPARLGGLRYTRHKIADYGAIPTEKMADILRIALQDLNQQLSLKCIFIDCPAASDNFSEAAGWLADYVVIMTQPDRVSRRAAADLEGLLIHNIPAAQRPFIGWVVNKITFNYSPETLNTIFQEVNVLAYIPFEESIAAAYGETTFIRELGLSTFEIKLQLICKRLFEDKHRHLIPDPIKMLPTRELKRIESDLKLRISRTSKILKVALYLSLSLGLLCFLAAIIASLFSWFSEGPPKPIIDPSTGSVTIPQASAWYHRLPTVGIFSAGFMLFVLAGIAGFFFWKQRQKENKVQIEPTQLVREIFLSPEKEDLG
jgi:cellulose biosynthesis protein BcsQ